MSRCSRTSSAPSCPPACGPASHRRQFRPGEPACGRRAPASPRCRARPSRPAHRRHRRRRHQGQHQPRTPQRLGGRRRARRQHRRPHRRQCLSRRQADRRRAARGRADRRDRPGRRSLAGTRPAGRPFRLGLGRLGPARRRHTRRPPARMRRAGDGRLFRRPRLQGHPPAGSDRLPARRGGRDRLVRDHEAAKAPAAKSAAAP